RRYRRPPPSRIRRAPRRAGGSFQLWRDVSVAPGRLKRWRRRRFRQRCRLELLCELQTGIAKLPACSDLEVAVASQPGFIPAAIRTECFLRRHVADTAVGELDRE